MITINLDTFSASGGQYTIQITKDTHNIGWDSVVLDNVAWMTVLERGAISNTLYEITVEVEPNDSAVQRTAGLAVDTIDDTASFTLTQEAGEPATVPVGSIEGVTPSGNVGASGGTLVYDVLVTDGIDNLSTANVVAGNAFCTLANTQHGVISGNNLVTRFTFSVAANPTTSTRTIGIQFIVSDGTNTDIVSASKTQDASSPTAPVGTIVASSPSGNINAAGGTLVFDVKVSNGDDSLTRATITTGDTFVTLQSTEHGVVSGNDIITRFTFSVAANESSSSRSIGIQFTVENQYETATVSASKTQDGAVTTPQVNIVAQTPTANMPAAGGDFTVDVEAVNAVDSHTNGNVFLYDGTCYRKSITHGIISGGKTVTRFVFHFNENLTTSQRSAMLYFEVSDDNGNTDSTSLSKTQDAGLGDIWGELVGIYPEDEIISNGGTLVVDARVVGGTDALTKAAVISGGDYCSLISLQHGLDFNGTTVSRFIFNVSNNPHTYTRDFIIEFTFFNGNKEYKTLLQKTQKGTMPTNKVLEPNYSVLPWYNIPDWQNAKKWWVYGRIYPLYTPAPYMLPFQIMRAHRSNAITSFKLYKADGTLVGEFLNRINAAGLTIKSFENLGLDVIVYNGNTAVFTSLDNGQYFCTLSDGKDTWTSDVFTAVNDISPYLRIEWYDNEDFIVDNGVIVYGNPAFKNVVYLSSDIAKPEYKFEDEGENRDGYFFPSKQISEKTYRFSFLAPEYLLDVMRLIRMADNINISYNGKVYAVDTFLMTPEWEDNGDVAKVSVEFETATVVKKLGLGYVKSSRGDYNIDFNDDFNNQ